MLSTSIMPQNGRYCSRIGCVCESRSREPALQEFDQEECGCPCRRVVLPYSSVTNKGMNARGRGIEQMETNIGPNCSEERHRLYLENLAKQNKWGKPSVSCPAKDRTAAPHASNCPLSFCPASAVAPVTCYCDQNLRHQQQCFCSHSKKVGVEYQRKVPYDDVEDYHKKQDFLCSCLKDRNIQNICDDMRKKMRNHKETCIPASQAFCTAAKKSQPQEPRIPCKPCATDFRQSATCVCPGKSKDCWEFQRNMRLCIDKTYEGEVKCPKRNPVECPAKEATFPQDAYMNDYVQKFIKTGDRVCIFFDNAADNALVKENICPEEKDNCNCYSQDNDEKRGKQPSSMKKQNDACNEDGMVIEGYDTSPKEEAYSRKEGHYGYSSSMENIPGGSQSRFLEDYEECDEFISYQDRSNTQNIKSQMDDRSFGTLGCNQVPITGPQKESPKRPQTTEQYIENKNMSSQMRRKIFIDSTQYSGKGGENKGFITSTPCHSRENLPNFNLSSISQRNSHQQQNDHFCTSQEELNIGGNKYATSETRKRKTIQDDQGKRQEEDSPAISGFKTLHDNDCYSEPKGQVSKVENRVQDNCVEEQQQQQQQHSPPRWVEPRGIPIGTPLNRKSPNLENCSNKKSE